jgi:hypothetical protein
MTNGYGRCTVDGGQMTAHRVSYIITHGSIPDGYLIRHACDNKLCVNPFHLSIGMHKDNHQDMLTRGRGNPPKGVKHWNAKLSTRDVVDIRVRVAAGETRVSLAKEYKISHTQVNAIVKGTRWAHIEAI